LEEADFTYITDKVMEFADRVCGGKIVSVLEGGYHLPSLRKSAREHVISLMKKVPSEVVKTAVAVATTTTTTTTTTTIVQQATQSLDVVT
jgi:acetoin utilization deacetylase AcuC-like enzyme